MMATELTNTKKEWFKKVKESNKLFMKDELILKYCNNRDVLDVGCVGQDINYNNSEWIHGKVKRVARNLKGVDIDKEGIKKLKERGYDIVHYNELGTSCRFDIILMLDVIEHVDNPVKFIENYARFLNKNGKLIITTPNSNRSINFVSIFFRDDYSVNHEHTFWFCPKTLIEVFGRVGVLEVSNFYWLEHYSSLGEMNWKNKIIYFLDSMLIKLRKNFSPNFMFIVQKKK